MQKNTKNGPKRTKCHLYKFNFESINQIQFYFVNTRHGDDENSINVMTIATTFF